MADTTTTIKLRAVDDGAIATVNNINNAFTGLTIGTTALAVGFKGLQKVSDSSFAQFTLGASNAQKLSGAIGKLTDVNSKALQTFSALSDITFLGGQALTFAKGVQDATAVYARIPQTLDLLRSSGVNTRSIEDFYTLTDAVKGSEASLESFAVSAVEQLGRFEQAAARAGTILRSSVNFDAAGNALRANVQEQRDNAFQVQDIVNKQLQNAVTSTDALIGQYEVLSSGFTKAADSQQVLAAGLKLTGIGQAGGVATDPGETLRLLGKTLNAYQQSASEAGKTAAVLNAIVENGITTVPELSQGFGQTATTARAAGIALNDLAASTAVLTTQGINTATALTGLQRVAGAIIQKTPEAQQAINNLSLNGQKIRFDQAEIQAKGFTQALIDLNKAAGGNVKTLQEIFPEEVAFRTVLALLAQDGQKLTSVLNSVSSTTTKSLDDVFNISVGDRVSRFQQIVNRFQELIIKVAASVAPVFEPGLAVLDRIATVFSDLPDPVKEAIGQFIAFQITTRATTGAVGILFQTLLNLAGTYLQVRLISLALSGQLGKELAVVRDLVTQRKGLLAVGLQLFGVDQRYRLATEATTAALEKQNVVTKAIAAGRAKVGEVFNKNVAGFTGQSVDAGKQLVDKGKQVAGGVLQSAKNVGLGLAEATGVVATPQILGPDGKPLGSSGLERIKQEAQKAGEAIAQTVAQTKQSLSTIDTGTAISNATQQAKDKAVAAYSGIKQGAEQAKVAIVGEAAATAAATTATTTHTVAISANELAERGLAQTRIFGRNVVFSTQGPLGAINKLLATEITLKATAAGATKSLAVAQGTATGAAKILGIALGAPIAGIGALGKAAIGIGAQGITALVGTLGPLAPLLAVGALAVAVFREDLFGLRKAANEAADGLGEVIKKDAEIAKQFGRERRLIEFKSELKDETSPQQIETRLEQLRLSGDLTTGQFNQLRETLVRVGEQGQVTAKGLEEFRSQLEAIRQGATLKPDKGVGDRIGDFFGGFGSGILGAPEYIGNVAAAAVFNPLEFFNLLEITKASDRAVAKVYQDREADRLIQNFSRLSIAAEVTGDASLATAEKLAKYRQGLGLTVEANEKLRKGTQLTQEDLEREGQLFNEQKTRNEQLISGFGKEITDQKKVLEQVKDPELKKSFEDRINLLEQERQALEKRNEALKAGREEFVKYYIETLPNLKRAITESSNPQQALINAQESFSQQFKLDAQGETTPFLKDITTLRNEAQQYVAQVLEAYQSGLFEQNARPGVAEAQVAQKLREARDNKITLPDGTQGFRLGLSDRLAATGQIVEFEQQASKARGEAVKLEVEQIKLAQQQRVLGEEEAQKRIAQLNLKALRETLNQKQIEVKEYAQFPVRKAQLEREAAAIRVQVEQAVAAEDLRQLSLRRERRQNAFNLEIEQIKTLQAERAISGQQAERQIANIQLQQTSDRLNTLIEDYNKSGKTSIELEQRIAQTRLQLRQQEAAEVERLLNLEGDRQKRILANTTQLQTLVLQGSSAKLESRGKDLEDSQKLFNSTTGLQLVQADAVEAQLNNQLKFTGDVSKRAVIEREIAENKLRSLALTQEQERVSLNVQTQINKLQLEREEIQLNLQQIENKRQIAELNLELIKARREKRTPEEIQAVELQLKAATQQTNLLTQQGERLERSKFQQQQIAENSQKELEIKQRLAITNAEIEARLARQREIQAGIEKIARNIELAAQTSQLAGQIQINQSEALVKAYDQQKNLLQASQNLIKGRVDFVTGELQIASQLSTSEYQKQRIAQTIAAIKLNSLEKQLAMEEKVLNLNLAQQAAQLEQEKIRNRVSQSQNAADVAKVQADLSKTKADPNTTPEAIRAAELSLQAKVEEGISLQFAGSLLSQQGEIQQTLGNIERQNLKERGQLQRDQAKSDFIQTLNEGEQRKFSRQLRKEALQRGLGVSEDAIAPASQAFIRQTKNTFFGQDYALEPLQQYYAGVVNSRINPTEPSLQIQFPDFEEFRKNQLARLAEFGYQLPLPSKLSSQDLNTIGQVGLMDAVSKLTELVNQKLSNPNSVSLEVPITNNFSTQDATTRQASDTVTQQIRQQLYDLGRELGR